MLDMEGILECIALRLQALPGQAHLLGIMSNDAHCYVLFEKKFVLNYQILCTMYLADMTTFLLH